MAVPFFNPGDAIVWRSRPHEQIGYVMPVTVVADTPQYTVLFQVPGSVCKRRTGRRGGPRGRTLLPDGWDGGYENRVWSGRPNLRLHAWGTSHTIIRYWDFASNRAEGWYVNLEALWRRTRIGVDTQDFVLDITVSGDLSSWFWKDEDELSWSVDAGLYSAEEAAAIRAEGVRVVAALQARAWPFCADWSEWRPNPAWAIPTLPADWADPSL